MPNSTPIPTPSPDEPLIQVHSQITERPYLSNSHVKKTTNSYHYYTEKKTASPVREPAKGKNAVNDVEACLMFFEIERLIKLNKGAELNAENWRNKFISIQSTHKREIEELNIVISRSKYSDSNTVRNSQFQDNKIRQLEDKIALISSEN